MTEIFPFLIIENQLIHAEQLSTIIVQLGYTNPYLATTYEEAMKIFETKEISLILLDIFLTNDSRDGIDLILEMNQTKMIPHIFVTANEDRATLERAKQTNSHGYLSKPFDVKNVFSNIEIALFNSNRKNEINQLKYIYKGKNRQVEVDSIQYIKSDGVYLKVINDTDQIILIRSTFKELAIKLPSHFLQIHRSVMVNSKKVLSFTAHKVMVGEEELNLGRSHKKKFLEKMNTI